MKYLKTFENYQINEEEEIIGKVRKFFTGYETGEDKQKAMVAFEKALGEITAEYNKSPESWVYVYKSKDGKVMNEMVRPWEDRELLALTKDKDNKDKPYTKTRCELLKEEAKENNYRGTLEVGYWGTKVKGVKYVPGASEFQKTTMGSSSQTVGT
jgi:hypothetical protein